MMSFLEVTDENTTKMNQHLNDVLVAQEFQDLTGQVIKRVIALVTEVEKRLVHLIKVASEAERVMILEHEDIESDDQHTMLQEVLSYTESSSTEAEGPSVVACSQDEVDDLLGQLGF